MDYTVDFGHLTYWTSCKREAFSQATFRNTLSGRNCTVVTLSNTSESICKDFSLALEYVLRVLRQPLFQLGARYEPQRATADQPNFRLDVALEAIEAHPKDARCFSAAVGKGLQGAHTVPPVIR